MAYVPYLPPISPYVLPASPFDTLTAAYGVRLQWMQSHQCACVWGSSVPGSPDPNCVTCSGRGVYWDAPSAIFSGIITQMHKTLSPDESGFEVTSKLGWKQDTFPLLSIPASAGEVWQNATDYDAFVELDAITRYKSEMTVGGMTSVPYAQNLNIPATGAVSIWNVQTKSTQLIPYTVNGANVTISGYPQGTSYTIEYFAAPVYLAFRKAGGMPHIRPFGNGVVSLPRRFRLDMLDVWIRSRGGSDNTPQNPSAL